MPRRKRVATGGYVFHVLNRATARRRIFDTDGDYAAFERVLAEALTRVPVRLLSYCIMPNHWHLVLWPKRGADNDLSEFMRWGKKRGERNGDILLFFASAGILAVLRCLAHECPTTGTGTGEACSDC